MREWIEIATIVLSAISVVAILLLILNYMANLKNGVITEKQIKENFLKSQKAGKEFVLLIKNGFFLSLKTGNHGGDFPDKKQTENFKKYATVEIAEKVSSLEVSHEKFII